MNMDLKPDVSQDSAKRDPEFAVVHPVAARQSAPSTLIAQRIAAALDKAGSLSFETLVETVAEELYRQELRNGAAVLDIGLFGSGLFFPEVLGELRAGDGIYWEIKKLEKRHE